ncbi:Txe/YoeB family addiction module toxin [Spiribacter vilamensis]|uniref:Putative mRNA interferase YoeB n=1 Tax=Spiribacter vilamensis TaxID=531306 RepID=A0A4Q8D2R9_9GAMM|nr:Txe/YoeB family addiction module toxin [Spiribacter vilamensis]RZU99617.1 toxin YoeB [Spiribacter vilamensis]TVO61423.1 Txe/YoeB family addiction module toxin [Spiribacter vilamensis]
MRAVVFEGRTRDAYEEIRRRDRKLHEATRRVIRELIRCDDPAIGTGKPEPLRHSLSGLWSRRLSARDRIIYRFDETAIYIYALGGHYEG